MNARERPDDPYRALFHHLASGAAHVQLIVERGRVASIEILDSNAGFDRVRAALPQLAGTFSQVYDTGTPQTLRIGTGEALLSVSIYPVGHDEVMVLIDDVTARDQLDHSRKYAEEAFAVAFGASPAGMMLVDVASDQVVAVNSRLLEMTLDTRDDFIGRRAAELTMIISPSHEALLAEIERSGRLNGIEIELARKDGSSVWTLASTETITLHHELHRLSVFTDITGRKRLERRLLTTTAVGRHLAEASDFQAAIPDVLEALCRGEGWDCGAVWLPGADEGALQCHGTWRGPDVSEELDPVAHTVERSPAPLLRRVFATSAAAKLAITAATGMPAAAATAGMRLAVAFPILRGNVVLGVVAMMSRGTDTTLDTGERGLFDSVGRLLGLFLERTRAETALRELNIELEHRVAERTQALETSNRDLEAFSSSISHDLRAPLRAIHGFSEILLHDFAAALPPAASAHLTRIHASGVRLGNLIEDLLAFSRLGRGALRRGVVELDPLVRSVVDELLVDRRFGDRLEVRVLPLGRCHADASLLRPVWTNLVDNALKYSQYRDHIEIEIGREVRGTEEIYYVRDNGVGFDMAHADRLFGVFQRLHSSSDFAGTGIGLANVRRIVERHHGRVAATSEPGRGSRFEFTLGTETTRWSSSY